MLLATCVAFLEGLEDLDLEKTGVENELKDFDVEKTSEPRVVKQFAGAYDLNAFSF